MNGPDKTQKLLDKARAAHQAGNVKAAETLYKKIIRHNKSHLDAQFHLGTLYAEAGKPVLAVGLLTKAAEIAPRSPYIRNNLANVYRMLGKPNDAVRAYREALAIDDRFQPALLGLADLQLAADEKGDAELLFAKLAKIEPTLPEAQFNLARLKADRGEVESAREHLERYLELDAEDSLGGALLKARLDGTPPPATFPPALVRAIYRDKAARWDSDINRPGREYLGPKLVADALAKAPLTATDLAVLDLGCGTGLCGPSLKPMAASLVGVDLSKDMLEKARSLKLYDNLVEGDVLAYMADNTGRFDLITAAGLVIFFSDLAPLFSAIAGSLTDKGVFIATLYKSDGQDCEIRHNVHFAHSRAYIEQSTKQAGLSVVTLDEIVHEFDHNQSQPGWLATLQKG